MLSSGETLRANSVQDFSRPSDTGLLRALHACLGLRLSCIMYLLSFGLMGLFVDGCVLQNWVQAADGTFYFWTWGGAREWLAVRISLHPPTWRNGCRSILMTQDYFARTILKTQVRAVSQSQIWIKEGIGKQQPLSHLNPCSCFSSKGQLGDLKQQLLQPLKARVSGRIMVCWK